MTTSSETYAANVTEGILKCLDVGEASYQEYMIQTRLVEKSKLLHDTIPSNRNEVTPKAQEFICPEEKMQTKMIESKKDVSDALRFIDYARERKYEMNKLLNHEITSTSYFLINETKEGHRLKKPDKFSLTRETREIVAKLPKDSQNVQRSVEMVVIDFMALVRKLPFKKLNLRTYSDLATTLMERIMANAIGSSRVDIIFDVYQRNSIKDGERTARGSVKSISIAIKGDHLRLPVDMNLFWNSMDNKNQIQNYLKSWMINLHCVSDKEIYFGGVEEMHYTKLAAGETQHCSELTSNQEEADDRILFHINHGYNSNNIKSVLVVSPDTDIFAGLLCHFRKTWKLDELYMKLGSGKTRKTVPLHLICHNFEDVLLESFPAIHALSGCDTTSKVGPKLACLNKAVNLGRIKGFGIEPLLTDQMILNAETFLLECLNKTRDVASFDEYRSMNNTTMLQNWTSPNLYVVPLLSDST